MSRSTDVALALALAIASLGGVLLFPRALEPGRSEENGIALNLLVDRGDGAKANDWYTGTATLRSRLSGGSLRLESHDSGLQIFSRPLALFAGECYAVVVHGREIAGTSQLVVSDEEVRTALSGMRLTPSADRADWKVVVDSGRLRRVTVVLLGQEDNVLELDRVALQRVGGPGPCG